MRSETLRRKTNYLTNASKIEAKRGTSLSTETLDTLIPMHMLTNGMETDVKRSSSLTTLCAMFTEWDSEEYIEKFYTQLLEIEGSHLFQENITALCFYWMAFLP